MGLVDELRDGENESEITLQSIKTRVEITLLDYSALADVKNNSPFVNQLKTLFDKRELEYYQPANDIGSVCIQVPVGFLTAIGITIPAFVKDEENFQWVQDII